MRLMISHVQRQQRLRATARLGENHQGAEVKAFNYRQCVEALRQSRYYVVL